jgi:hypothetical protein
MRGSSFRMRGNWYMLFIVRDRTKAHHGTNTTALTQAYSVGSRYTLLVLFKCRIFVVLYRHRLFSEYLGIDCIVLA